VETKTKTFNTKINFADYYNSLSDEDKNAIRYKMCPVYMAESTFFYKVRENKFNPLEIEKLTVITGIEFEK